MSQFVVYLFLEDPTEGVLLFFIYGVFTQMFSHKFGGGCMCAVGDPMPRLPCMAGLGGCEKNSCRPRGRVDYLAHILGGSP